MRTVSLKCLIKLLLLCLMVITTNGCTYLLFKTATSDLPPGTAIDDMWLEKQIDFKLADITPERTDISVAVYDRTAMIVGFVPSQTIKTHISHALANTDYLKHYVNLVTIRNPLPEVNSSEDFKLTYQVLANMVGHLNPMQFKVLAFNREIYIMGYATPAEHKLALYLASHTIGVKKVIDAIKPYPSQKSATIQCIAIDSLPCQP